jgi:hypothetical protein
MPNLNRHIQPHVLLRNLAVEGSLESQVVVARGQCQVKGEGVVTFALAVSNEVPGRVDP